MPQRIFHYLCADEQQQWQRKRVRQQQMQEQRLWVRQAEARQRDQQRQSGLPPSGLQAPGGRSSHGALPESDSATLSLLQLQSRLAALCGVLGREVALVVLTNQPQLLDLDPATAQHRLAALSQLMGLEAQGQGQLLRSAEEEGSGAAGAPVQPGPLSDRLLLPSRASSPSGVSLGLAALAAGGEGPGPEPPPGDSSVPELRGAEAAAAVPESGGSAAAPLWWMLERRGDVLLMAPEQLQANLEALAEGLR